ncbi:elongator complex protein 2 [Hemiscyllium ocellatum]|uniref:elongator complex protein 2 n=1 Tax=Hemiscyllium ocellatum TaxID=170820 RepID=UPI002965FE33|nr:elongator complex protein 2 [Hemiscyllium ocellatum]
MKMAPPVETAHVARCANRTPHALSWGRGGRVAFASCRSVVLYEPEEASVTEILNGHKGRVNCVQWAHRDDCGPETELVSGGSDNCLIVWELQNFKFAVSTQLEGHSGAVCAVTAMYETVNSDEHQKLLIASAAADSSVRIWTKQGSVGECVQTLTFGNGFMMDVALAQLPGSNAVILACGGDDSKIYLFVREDGHFQKIHSLMGHEDWIRGVEWALCDGNLLLASCSQDCLIRIWRIFVRTESTSKSCDGGIIKLKEDIFHVQSDKGLVTYAVTLETVLAGHDNWVYGVHWQPPFQKDGRLEQPLSLLSASMDKTMILWASDEESDMWLEKVRVGEVGGNTLGFFGCQFSPDGSMVLAHAFHGALHLWSRNKSKTGEWEPEVILSGHFGSVQDLIWDPEGEFILSVGSDQTTRLFAPWRRAGREQVTWHEIARPQIHGYDMQCLAIIGRFQFVSGADEKVLRVFTATKNFVENFSSITCTPLENLLSSNINDEIPEGASVPALGLSNKAVFQGDLAANASKMDQSALPLNAADQYPQTYFHPISLTEPPSEDHLLQNTLWAEVQKLYGHGFEIFCVACNNASTALASACKASKVEHAAIVLWSTSNWKQILTLPFHNLTVTQLAFSPDDRFLLAVSRDRTWSLWKHHEVAEADSGPFFSLFAHTDKKTSIHSRIIWTCDWTFDSKYFVTGSRDKKVIVWGNVALARRTEGSSQSIIRPCSSVLDVGDAATAVSFSPVTSLDESYILAVGLDCGNILLYKWKPHENSSANADWMKCLEFDKSQCHTLTVKRLQWRRSVGRAGYDDEKDSNWLQLASCSTDYSINIFNVNRLSL